MPLTPLEIHNREFRKSFRGYDEEEVDEFLDQIVESYEALYKENLSLKEVVASKDTNISHYKDLEDTLKQTLVVAQQTADEIRSNSEKQAEVMLKEAELKVAQTLRDAEDKARKIVGDAEVEVGRMQKEAEDLRHQIQMFKVKFRSFLDSQLAMLKEDQELFLEPVGESAIVGEPKREITSAGLEAAASEAPDGNEGQLTIINKDALL